MSQVGREKWLELAEQASVEKDPVELARIIKELAALLELKEKERRSSATIYHS